MAALAFVFDGLPSNVFVTTIRKIVVTKNVIVSDVIFCRSVCAYNVFISIARRMVKLCLYIIFNIIFNCNIN